MITLKPTAIVMAEDKSFEQMPCFMWKINDISVLKIESPIFSVNDVKFWMLYHQGERISTLYIVPVVGHHGHQQSSVPYYDIKTSVSIIDPDKSFKDLYYIQKKINQNSSGHKVYHLIWEIENKIFENLYMVQEENEIKSVTFLCEFGEFCEYRKDVANVDDPCRESHYMERMGKDLNDLPLKDSSSQLQCGDQTPNFHEVILSARSTQLTDEFRVEKTAGKEVKIKNMVFEVLENVSTYIKSGQLKDSKPSVELLKKLYNTAHNYEVESLKIMTSFRLIEILVKAELPSSQEVLGKEKLPSGKEVLDKEKLNNGKEVLDKEKLANGKEILDKEKLPSSPYVMNKESLTCLTLELFQQAHGYEDENFKKSIIHSIVYNNDFILNEELWKDLCKKDPKLAVEVYDVLVKKLL